MFKERGQKWVIRKLGVSLSLEHEHIFCFLIKLATLPDLLVFFIFFPHQGGLKKPLIGQAYPYFILYYAFDIIIIVSKLTKIWLYWILITLFWKTCVQLYYKMNKRLKKKESTHLILLKKLERFHKNCKFLLFQFSSIIILTSIKHYLIIVVSQI